MRVLPEDTRTDGVACEWTPSDEPSTIVSIGYEGRTAEDLIERLVIAGVTVLVDVRQNAISRKKGLSKRALHDGCVARGIQYVHEPSLGNPKENRDGFRAGTPESRRAFGAHLDAYGADAIARVRALLKDQTVGLVCYEADHHSCHRSLIAARLSGDAELVRA